MATIACDTTEARPGKPPISAHGAFPAIVALWFAALLGLGSLVLPPVLLDRIVAATGLAALVPAMAPPLGMTARGLIALAAALAGAGLGAAIARRVAAARTPEQETRIANLAAGLKPPISVHDELGGEGVINGHGLPIDRCRALAITEDDGASDFLYLAPAPGEDIHAEVPVDVPPADIGADDEPLELCDAVEAGDVFAEPAAGVAHEDGALELPAEDEVGLVPPFRPFDGPDPVETPAREPDTLEIGNNAAGPRGLEPLAFFAPSLTRHAASAAEEPGYRPEPAPEPDRATGAVSEFEPSVMAIECEPETLQGGDWEAAPLEGLGLVQLVQRLGSTLEKRREWIAQRPLQPGPAFGAVGEAEARPPLPGVEAGAAEEAAEAMGAYFGSAPSPEATEASDGELAAPTGFARSLPRQATDEEDAPARRPAVLRGLSDEDRDDGEDEGGTGENCSSLLAMRNPFVQAERAFVRIEEPDADAAGPTVVFPGETGPALPVAGPPAAPGLSDPPGKSATATVATPQPAGVDTDAALRAALATLQRMSGAA